MADTDLSTILPRVLIVSRRCIRKNKFVDFVGEYHLDLIVNYGAVPVIVPRVTGVHMLLDSFEPIHGVLLCEGEDIDPSLYESETSGSLSPEELDEIRQVHASDTTIDKEKDSIELRLAKLCLERNIPFLGICRGSQILNVASGGTLYQDVGKELPRKSPEIETVSHMDYDNYDGHRHKVSVIEGTPLADWFKNSLEEEENGKKEILVNSYHHQGVRKLAERFSPMAFSPDGLIEGFYDPETYNPEEGKFIMGLQFHPERMRQQPYSDDEFDYPGCPRAYQEFVKAVIAYKKKKKRSLNLEHMKELEKKKRSLNVIYKGNFNDDEFNESGAQFLELNSSTVLSLQQEKRLKQIGATVRNASAYLDKTKMNEEKEKMGMKEMMKKMSVQQLSELISFYDMMGSICSDLLHTKLRHSDVINVNQLPL